MGIIANEGVINYLQGRYDGLKTYFPSVPHDFDFESTLIPESRRLVVGWGGQQQVNVWFG